MLKMQWKLIFRQNCCFGQLSAPMVKNTYSKWAIYGLLSLHLFTNYWNNGDKPPQNLLFLCCPSLNMPKMPKKLIFHHNRCFGQLWASIALFSSPSWDLYWTFSLHHVPGYWFDGSKSLKKVCFQKWPHAKVPVCSILQKHSKLPVFTSNVQIELRVSRWWLGWSKNHPETAPGSVLS